MTIFDIPVTTLEGEPITLETFRGRNMLIVNVASRCGLTPQYKALEDLHRRRQADLVVLGFPCNQFGGQEPADEAGIRQFCSDHYSVTFPLFAKIEVNGPNAHPLYRHLKAAKPGFLGRQSIWWNFTKFLVAKDGQVLRRFAPRTRPETIEKELYR